MLCTREIFLSVTIGLTYGSAAFLVGSTNMTYNARDAAGNLASCSFLVVIVDNEAPVFNPCPTNQIGYTNATDSIWGFMDYGSIAASDNVGVTYFNVTNPVGMSQSVDFSSVQSACILSR